MARIMLGVPVSRNTLRGNVRAEQVEPLVTVATRRPLVRRAVELGCARVGLHMADGVRSRQAVLRSTLVVVDLADPGDRTASSGGDIGGSATGPVARLLICDGGSRAAMAALLVDNTRIGGTVDAVICVDDESVELDRALQHAAAGRAYVSSRAARLLFDLFRSEHNPQQRARVVRLTAREADVARCLAQGLTTKGTAAALDISLKTVEAHRSTVFRKFGARSAAEVVAAVLADPSLVGGLREGVR
jgi:DNA-binding NarL/FixJ family response regulator